MNASQSYQQPSGNQQMFFKKRASSNTNPPNHAQSIVQNSPPKAVDKGPGSTENGQQMDKGGQLVDPKGSEGGKVSSPKTSAGASSSMQAHGGSQQQQSSTSASSMTQA